MIGFLFIPWTIMIGILYIFYDKMRYQKEKTRVNKAIRDERFRLWRTFKYLQLANNELKRFYETQSTNR